MERREVLRSELARTRSDTDALFDLISPEAVYQRPVAERNRLVFYRGHLEAFDWNVLGRRALNAPAFQAEFDKLFERGIDPEPGAGPSDSAGDWPKLAEIESYTATARQWIDAHVNDLDPGLLQMAIEHRQMHAETFAYMMHNLPYSEKRGPKPTVMNLRAAPANPMVQVPEATATLGNSSPGFSWDNERVAHQIHVPSFTISKYKISNGEYMEFVRDGGPVPNFWARETNQWFFRGMFECVPLPLDRPVWITWRQADAFANWRGLALPTEAQYRNAAAAGRPEPARDNFDMRRWDPIPVDAANSGNGHPEQMVGNGWEWTRDVFAPYKGFEVSPFYPGYSADFFDGGHYVLKGASPRTAALLTRPGFRNWFRPDYPYMYAGFRLVENR